VGRTLHALLQRRKGLMAFLVAPRTSSNLRLQSHCGARRAQRMRDIRDQCLLRRECCRQALQEVIHSGDQGLDFLGESSRREGIKRLGRAGAQRVRNGRKGLEAPAHEPPHQATAERQNHKLRQ
jgi:hypothetical protein